MERLGTHDPRRVGPYRLAARAGTGGMGQVYAAKAARGGLTAVKVIHDEHSSDPDFRARFAREVELISRVRSPYLPVLRGADPQAPRPWLATAYIPGLTLREWVNRNGPLPSALLPAFAAAVAEALRDVHGAGIVHRDLKPGNVILAASGPVVLDFGIARAVEETALTRTGLLVGTPGWVSPEQYEGRPATPASDVFAWGALVAFAATGRGPFGRGSSEVLAHRVSDEPPDLTGVAEQWRPLLSAALSKDPELRPTAEETLGALHGAHPPAPELTARLLAGVWNIPVPPPELPPRSLGRPRLSIAAAGLALLLAAAGLSAWALRGEPDSASEGQADGQSAADSADTGGDTAKAPETVDWTSEAPELATDRSTANGWECSVEFGEVEGEDSAIATMILGNDALAVALSDATRPGEDVLVHGRVLDWPAGMTQLTHGNFTLTTPGGQVHKSEGFDIVLSGSANRRPFTLTFRDAPPAGLLTVQGVDPEISGAPPVSVCYTAALWQGAEREGDTDPFSTDYTSCG